MSKFAVWILGVFSLLLSVHAWACTGGQEWVKEVGIYMTDITDDTPVIAPRMTVHFDFALMNNPSYDSPSSVKYSEAHVELQQGNENIFTKVLPYDANRELAGFDYEFPDKNTNYTLNVDFQKDGKSLAATTVPLTVGEGDRPLPPQISLFFWSAIVLLLGFMGYKVTRSLIR